MALDGHSNNIVFYEDPWSLSLNSDVQIVFIDPRSLHCLLLCLAQDSSSLRRRRLLVSGPFSAALGPFSAGVEAGVVIAGERCLLPDEAAPSRDWSSSDLDWDGVSGAVGLDLSAYFGLWDSAHEMFNRPESLLARAFRGSQGIEDTFGTHL